MRDDVRGVSRSLEIATVLLLTTAAAVACSSKGTVGGTQPATSQGSSTGIPRSVPPPTSQSHASGLQGSPTTPASPQDATVTRGEAAAALKAYEDANNAVNAALDIPGEARIESGELLAVDQCALLYAQGIGGAKADALKAPQTLADPVFYIVRAATYPRTFFATVTAKQSGVPDAATLMHFTQDHAGAPWLVDATLQLIKDKQWPAFAVGSDGVLDYSATQLNDLPLSTTDLFVADRNMLTGGKTVSPFASDAATSDELAWIKNGTDNVTPAKVDVTVSTTRDPLPTYIPLKDGGELAIYGTKISVRATQAGRTFTFGDQGWAKVAGTGSVVGGFTTDSVWIVGAIDPPEKSGKIEKIAYNGGLVSVEH